ncbi:ATP-binding protein [Streptomyces sp. WMMC500]|uniref:ATP-binding protein n=1 Tax=Streptomyces sp. WMMC500 TaxID=3015154 RepID=UPI00248BA3D9|nr:ATP-binding protein [Streptomyces sp. WMMC500]WBB58954.1 ATP-binding protein [Streptomyces sp. WMMC500]
MSFRSVPPGALPPEGEAGSGAAAPARPGRGDAAPAGEPAPAAQVRRLRLVGASGMVPRARDFARRALEDWGWLPAANAEQRAAAEDVLLVVSELVTNACLHGGGPDELRLRTAGKVLRLEVSDPGTGTPEPRTPHRASRPGGHGMFIVQRLCLDWGVQREPGEAGKTVWAELSAPL